jgi:aldehyde:ferredoxin oxidoreductase
MLMEATECGYYKPEDGLQWCGYMGMIAKVDQIAGREGIGDLLADGTDRAAISLG